MVISFCTSFQTQHITRAEYTHLFVFVTTRVLVMRSVVTTDPFFSFRRALLFSNVGVHPRKVSAAAAAAANSSSKSSTAKTTTNSSYDVDSILELQCHAIASDGSGVCKLPDERICLVAGATPDREGVKVLVRITQVKKTVAFGVKVFAKTKGEEEVSPAGVSSTHYQQPFCAHFYTCGGCSWQDVKY